MKREEYKNKKYHKRREKKEEKNIAKRTNFFETPGAALLLKPNFWLCEKLEKRFVLLLFVVVSLRRGGWFVTKKEGKK